MQVLFDLRPPHLVQSQETKVDMVRLLCVLLFVLFVLLSAFNIAFTTLQLSGVRAELARIRGEAERAGENKNRLDSRLAGMREFTDGVREYLAFTSQELPIVEFMTALEGAVPPGLKIENLEILPGNVIIKGSALSDRDIIDFGAKLDSMRGIVRKVDAPVTTRGAVGAKIVSDFSMTCDIRSISEIANEYPEQSGGSDEMGGGQ
jgi:hypothetical protein